MSSLCKKIIITVWKLVKKTPVSKFMHGLHNLCMVYIIYAWFTYVWLWNKSIHADAVFVLFLFWAILLTLCTSSKWVCIYKYFDSCCKMQLATEQREFQPWALNSDCKPKIRYYSTNLDEFLNVFAGVGNKHKAVVGKSKVKGKGVHLFPFHSF